MDPDHARELLHRERERVLRSIADAETREDDTELSDVDQHLGDEGSETFDAELDEGLDDALHEELAAIERAEQRLAEGTYGLSIESGQPIPDARLELIPWAERTVEEEQRYERSP